MLTMASEGKNPLKCAYEYWVIHPETIHECFGVGGQLDPLEPLLPENPPLTIQSHS